MSKVTMGQILSETEAFIKQSSAQFKNAGYAPASTVGGDGSGMPGSECDKPVGEDAKKPHAEVTQGWPSGAATGGGSDSEKIEGATALDATQPVAKPCKEPLVSADANAEPKTGAAKAASIANDLLSSIRNFQEGQKKTAEAAAPAAPAAAPAPKAAAAQPTNSVELTSDVLAKIASVILATEDGIAFAEGALTKAAGAEAARETFDFLQKQAAYVQGQNDAEAMIAGLVAQDTEMKKQAEAEYLQGQSDAAELIKMAVSRVQGNRGNAKLTKLAQEVADESVGDEAGGLPPEMAAGGMPPEMGSAPADEEISPEELEQALSELVQEGQIQPEAAQAILQAIAAAEQGGDTGSESGEMPPEAMGGEEAAPAPEEEAAAEEAAKEAMAKKASALVAAIRKQKSAQAGK